EPRRLTADAARSLERLLATERFERPQVSKGRHLFPRALGEGRSQGRFAAKNAIVPEKHLYAARTAVESVVVWTGEYQMLVRDALGRESQVQADDGASEIILIARDEAEREAPRVAHRVARAAREDGRLVVLDGGLQGAD